MKQHELVLVVYPSVYGFAFILFEGPHSPFDWGTKSTQGKRKNADIVAAVTRLLERYRPDLLAMEDFTERKLGRVPRIRRLYRAIADIARASDVDVRLYRRRAVRRCFASIGATTKLEIAQAVARHIPAFEHRLPPVRRPWMSEDRRQSLFDAAAVGITHYCEIGVEQLRR
jgi:Holliday junction resolvasome RuvABC endonuclease subunit